MIRSKAKDNVYFPITLCGPVTPFLVRNELCLELTALPLSDGHGHDGHSVLSNLSWQRKRGGPYPLEMAGKSSNKMLLV